MYDEEENQENFDSEYYFNELAKNGILEKIFKKVESRRALSLVNGLFYKTVCSVDNSEDIYRARFEQNNIIWENGQDNDNIYASVFFSQRIFTEIYLHQVFFVDVIGDSFRENYQQTFNLFKSTLKKISGELTKLTLYSCLLTENQLMYLLDSINPHKLKELNIVASAIIYEPSMKFKNILKFPSLEKLDLSGTNYGNPDIRITIYKNNEMHSLLKSIGKYSRQIKELSMHELFATWTDTFNFNLKKLCIQKARPANIRLASIVSFQVNLTVVDFLESYVMEDVLNEILMLPHLKCLKINVEGISLKGFSNICKTRTLAELFLKCNNSSPWIKSALCMYNIDFLKKFYLDISELDVDFYMLRPMIDKKIPEFHLVASQYYAMDCVFSTLNIKDLKVCTIELNINCFTHKKLLPGCYDIPTNLREFTLINQNPKFVNYHCDLSLVLGQAFLLRKIKIKGFAVSDKMFEAAIKNHSNLEELYLINTKYFKSTFILDKKCYDLILRYGGNLKIMEINCAKSRVNLSKQFPFITRRRSLKIFRIR